MKVNVQYVYFHVQNGKYPGWRVRIQTASGKRCRTCGHQRLKWKEKFFRFTKYGGYHKALETAKAWRDKELNGHLTTAASARSIERNTVKYAAVLKRLAKR